MYFTSYNTLELEKFFSHVPDLLAGPESRFSFFHGLGATSERFACRAARTSLTALIVSDALFYDVYTHVSELHLAEIGMDVEWSDVDVFENSEQRWGKTREYFSRRFYRLPVAKMRAM